MGSPFLQNYSTSIYRWARLKEPLQIYFSCLIYFRGLSQSFVRILAIRFSRQFLAKAKNSASQLALRVGSSFLQNYSTYTYRWARLKEPLQALH